MYEKKVSVIVPCFNIEKYIAKCLDSLVNQTLQEIEILVIDNNSNDGTNDIIYDYTNKYSEKIVYLHQPIPGVSAARNIALEIIKGEYVTFVDGDDFLSLDALEILYKTAKKTFSDLVIFGLYNFVDYDASKIRNKILPSEMEVCTNIYTTPSLLYDCNPYIYSKFFQSDTVIKYNIINDIEVSYGEDLLFFCEYVYYAMNIYSLQEALYFRRIRNESVSNKINNNILTHAEAFRKITEFYIIKGQYDYFSKYLLERILREYKYKLIMLLLTSTRGEHKIIYKYIDSVTLVLKRYYTQSWKCHLRKYGTNGNKIKYFLNIYLVNRYLLNLAIITPKFIIRAFKWIIDYFKHS